MMFYPLNFITKYWRAISIMLLLSITLFSLAPLTELPKAPGSDKTHHLVAYAALAYPASLRRPTGWKIIIILFAVYSGLIELVQLLVNRYSEFFDFVVNLLGLLLGTLLAIGTKKVKGA
jgi:VanZ family protein